MLKIQSRRSGILYIVLLIAFLLLLLLSLFYVVRKLNETKVITIDGGTITKIDTIEVIKHDTVIVNKHKVKTIYQKDYDTILVEKPFIKSFDTTFVDSNYLHITYFYPQDSFKLITKFHAREIIRRDSIFRNVYIPQQIKTDYSLPVITGFAGLAAGIIIGVYVVK